MYSGVVIATSKILNPGIQFSSFEFDAKHPQVTRAEIGSADGYEITSTIELDNVSTPHGLREVATDVHARAILRLGCFYGFVAEKPTLSVENLKSKTDCDAFIMLGSIGVVAAASAGTASVIVGRSPSELIGTLELNQGRVDLYFELFNQARTARNEVVEFLGYYQLIAAVIGRDSQRQIDRFFAANESPPTPTSRTKPNKDGGFDEESVYTRLRNEIAHIRYEPGTSTPVSIAQTKAGISEHVRGLRRLAVTAIKNASARDPSGSLPETVT